MMLIYRRLMLSTVSLHVLTAIVVSSYKQKQKMEIESMLELADYMASYSKRHNLNLFSSNYFSFKHLS
jgi:hypothetical protein